MQRLAPHDDEQAAAAYDEAKAVARHADSEVRRGLASREDAQPEILYYLAEDESPVVRRAIAINPSTPRHADRMLAEDVDDEVRCELARKIGRIVPRLSQEVRKQIQRLTLEILEILARDQLPRVRHIVAEEIKRSHAVPRHIVRDLARDVELIVAAPILEYSPLLRDEDLVEIIESDPVQGVLGTIARRETVNATVADAIAAREDADAIAALLANPSAQIREETLDGIIDRAPGTGSWHLPLVMRPELSLRVIRRIAGFVAMALLRVLEDRHDLPSGAADEVREAVARRIDEAGVDGDIDAPLDAEKAFAEGVLDDEKLLAALDAGNRDFVASGLALKSDLAPEIVHKVIGSQNPQSVTALVWKAGFSMRTAIQIQLRLARIPPAEVLNAKDGTDYPLDAQELAWHLQLFAG
ncbi:MAG: DUF2336 domain-containing protein [Proteobacteria bacterium]|nr:DUF2336 domain-containing protein [Pseudomonadota bacterium]